MNKRIIKKVAVLGSGIMGSRIALHFAGVGVPVLLLDMVPADAKGKQQQNSPQQAGERGPANRPKKQPFARLP
jgi:3-hydroxyacyl-CoA dehydrogenase